ncbi:TetR/AcrR family transcriptional regulator [Frankia sp. Ag45/Mut15]|uniref:TetR/AcrR family transcriptional regulator n=1 Tax=Frankia umida TaxID=573489 RepID=A0ABT0JSX1_9ACTN|nr:TetR/AcrR family transcriptional regulator [Frankia umida]MCK9874663.1 TetR/AcrR family transcriptional regulator [Frankia umida]
MAKRRGWAGRPPADEDEARARIIEAAIRCVDRLGPRACTLSDVAAELGVIRQTVYRYYPSAAGLFTAVGRASVDSFTDELAGHLLPIELPAPWAVEALATTIEWLPTKPYLTLALAAGHTEAFSRGVTSPVSRKLLRALISRSHVDWTTAGYDDRRLDELAELLLRLLQSMTIDPPDPARTGPQLRDFLWRWIAPAVTAPSAPRPGDPAWAALAGASPPG